MTTQDQTIFICILLIIAVPLGTFTAIKCIKKLTTAPVNTINRRADIELVDYIEPSQPLNTYYPNHFDLVNNQFPILERISYPPTYYSGSNPPFYRSGTLPYYQSVDGMNINSCLEFEINLLDLKFIFIIMIIMIIFWKMYSLYTMTILIPFSTIDINFRDSFDWKIKSYRDKPKISYLSIQNLFLDLSNLLESLEEDTDFSMSLSYISSYREWKNNKSELHPLLVEDPIIVNKESDPILISQFIMDSLNNKGLFISNWLFEDSSINSIDPVILTVTVPIKINI
jgi:hypothetical protein